ncbi:hypothetical protein ABN034_12545 [Actinopolymorpha sp. B11F2]|uniref:hypothetical protein n=1 Tax=Actinopolymorpha sp. B11F2 TaxID=3160862 RepID=UPI0032E498B8
MGIVYCGAYADQIGDHEGYAARRLPDGTLTGTWTADTAEFTAYVPACGCGWQAASEHPATCAGEEWDREEWDRDHLQPLIGRGRADWSAWADRVAAYAREIVLHIAADHPWLATQVAERLEHDIAVRRRIAEQLVDEGE